uniref:Uncharacterized protein n=1 Tax=Tanacetum cinerariifolium TaxID=118510 RepID=A0A6L2MYT3_TANCI|nr:hypothetical protein [Tanacetum cinerariifolium]
MDSFQGLIAKSSSSWHRPLTPSPNFMTMSIPSQDEPLTNRPVETIRLQKILLQSAIREGGAKKKGKQKPIKAIFHKESEAKKGETTADITPEHGHNITKEAKGEVKDVIE